jgi:hypothetical protein
MRRVLGELRSDGSIPLDMPLMAKNLGFTKLAFDKKLINLGFKQIWMEARRLAHHKALGREQSLEVIVTDEDLLEAASEILKSPIQFSSNRT